MKTSAATKQRKQREWLRDHGPDAPGNKVTEADRLAWRPYYLKQIHLLEQLTPSRVTRARIAEMRARL